MAIMVTSTVTIMGMRGTKDIEVMSLKAFHIVFVAVSMLFTVFFAVWAFQQYAQSKTSSDLGMGIGAIVGGVVLLVYGVWFLRKIKDKKLA